MEIFLILVSVGCGLLTLICYFATSNNQKNGGYMYLGGLNGAPANKFLNSNQKAKTIYNYLIRHGHKSWDDNEVSEILNLGAGAVFTARYKSDIIVVTEKTIIAFGDTGSSTSGADGQIYFDDKGLELFQDKLFKRECINRIAGSYQTTTPAKEKSVIGNAVAGAIIAGGVGAVVGAINAASHNANAKDTVKTHYVYSSEVLDYYFMFHYHMANTSFTIDKMYFSNDIIKSQTDYDYYKNFPKDGVRKAFNFKSESL